MLYGDLRTKFLSRLRRRDCSNTLADGFLEDSVTRIQRNLTNPAMEKVVTYTLDANAYSTNGYLVLPSDFLRMKELSVQLADGTWRKLDLRPLAEVSAGIGLIDYPRIYAREASHLILAPFPLDGLKLKMLYYAEFDDLSDVNDETILSITASDLIMFGALSYAADHFEDKRAERFEGRYQQIFDDIQNMAYAEDLTGATMSAAFSYPSDD